MKTCPSCYMSEEEFKFRGCDVVMCPRRSAIVTATKSVAVKENINHPPHYGGDTPHEVIKCLSAWGLVSDAYLWQAIKYIARAGKKSPDPLEDLKKAQFYLNRRISELEEKRKS